MWYRMRAGREGAVHIHSWLFFFFSCGENLFLSPRKILTHSIVFLYSVMLSGDKMLAVYKPSPTWPHLAKYIFLPCILLLLSLNISIFHNYVALHTVVLHPRFWLQLVNKKEQEAFQWDSPSLQISYKAWDWDQVTSQPRSVIVIYKYIRRSTLSQW